MTNKSKHDDPLLPSAEVRSMCGDITPMTLWRWRDTKDFPKPCTINNRNDFQLSEGLEWLAKFKK